MSISSIRPESTEPGLSPSEISFLKLIELLTNGTKVNINITGTKLTFYPGIITNGDGLDLEFDCSEERALAFYLEGILPLSILGKSPLTLTLRGVTNDTIDVSIDTIKDVYLPILAKFGIEGASL